MAKNRPSRIPDDSLRWDLPDEQAMQHWGIDGTPLASVVQVDKQGCASVARRDILPVLFA